MAITLDQFRDVDLVIDKANDNFIQRQFVSQGDYKGRTLTVQVTDNGVIGEVPGLVLNLRWQNQASGLTDLSAFAVLDKANSIFRLEYPQHMMTPGKVIANMQIIQDGKVTNLKEFELTVQKLAGQPVGIVEKAEFSALVAILADSNKFRTDISSLGMSKVDKGGNEQVTLPMLSQEVKESMTGGSVAVVGTSSVGDLNLQQNVSLAKFKDIELVTTNNNIIDPTACVAGGFYHPADGAFITNIGYGTTDYFKVESGKTYHLFNGGTKAITFWDADYKFVIGLEPVSTSFIVPNDHNIMYARSGITLHSGFNILNTRVTTVPGSISTDNRYDYRFELNDKFLYKGPIDLTQVGLLRENPSENRFNPAKRLLSGYYTIDTGAWVASGSFDCTDFIPVLPNEVYYKHINSGGGTFWDANKQYVTGFGQTYSNFITVPNNKNIKFMTMPVGKNFINQVMIVRATTAPSEYIPYVERDIRLTEEFKIDKKNISDKSVGYNQLDDNLQGTIDLVNGTHTEMLEEITQYSSDIKISRYRNQILGTTYWMIYLNKETFEGGKIRPIVKITASDITSSDTKSVQQFALANNYLSVINGGVFDVATSLADGLVISSGQILQSGPLVIHPDMYTIGVKTDGTLVTYDSTYTAAAILADGCTDAMVGFIPLVQNGAVVGQAIFDSIPAYNQKNPRQILGQMTNGDYIVATFDGRAEGEAGVTLPEAAEIMQKYGVQFAFNLDGGGSTQTFVSKKRTNRLIENRKVATVFAFENQAQ